MQFWHMEMANRTVGCHLSLSVQSLLCSDTVGVPICSEVGNSNFCVLEGELETCMLLALLMQVPLGLMQGRVKVIKHFSKWEPYNSSLLELKVAEVIKFSQDMQLPGTLGFSFKMLRICDMSNQGPHAGWLICCISLLAQSFWGTCAVTMSGWWGPGVYLFAWDT